MLSPKIIYKQYGGKSSIASWVVSYFPKHRIYLEPFVGSCSVLFRKSKSFIEIINDLDGRLINMYDQIRKHPKELAALLWATPYSSANWRNVDNVNKLEDARLFIAKGCQFYCGGPGSTWAMDKSPANHKPKSETWADWFLRILPAAKRLKTVQILQEDALKAIARVYMESDALIYADPPYFGHEDQYSYKIDYEKMVTMFSDAKCKVVVSEYETAREYYKNWYSVSKTTAGRAGTGHKIKAREKTEVLFMNFEPEPLRDLLDD